jgi:glycosyltransferase involved in cell wall biosynthesis/SAM-dependent methyltransferase
MSECSSNYRKRGNLVEHRKNKILSRISPGIKSGLEIGPLNRPVVTKCESNGLIKYIDHVSTEGLRKKFINDPSVSIGDIVEVDYVWGDKTLVELVGGKLFDYVIASHVIEHVPNMLGWLKEVAEVLTDKGILSLVVPDKRYTFDYPRELSTPGMIIEAYLRQYRRPCPQAIFDHVAHICSVTAEAAWNESLNHRILQPQYPTSLAYSLAQESILDEKYHDVHVNVFTPSSFLSLLEKFSRLGLLDFVIVDFHITTKNTFEFFVSLERLPRTLNSEEALQLQLEGLNSIYRRQPFLSIHTSSYNEDLTAKDRTLREENQTIGYELRLKEMQHRLDALQNSFSWRLTAPLRRLADWFGRLSGMVIAANKAVEINIDSIYPEWIRLYDTLSVQDQHDIHRHVVQLACNPLISIVLPVYNTPEQWLRQAIESVRNQLYPHWELCIADDASTEPHVRTMLEEYRQADSRIKVVYREKNGHISNASNSALDLATGEFIALLDHDDELTLHALYMVAVEHNQHPDADIIYSDEDKIDADGKRFHPLFKPDWNPDLFFSQNYISHLGVYRTTLVRAIGGFREGYEGSQDYDLCIRCVEHTSAERIRHIPWVLYHWRAIAGSTAISVKEKAYAESAGVRALTDHFAKVSPAAEVRTATWPTTYQVDYPLPAELPLVSLIIPTRDDVEVLRRCVESICRRTSYQRYELIIVDNQSRDPKTLAYLEKLQQAGTARVLRFERPFNYSAINNFAVNEAKGSLIGLLNNDVEVVSKDWLEAMVRQALRPEIGAVGAKLYYPNGKVQHGGVILGMRGIAGHAHCGVPKTEIGYWGRLVLPQNFSAVTAACLVVRRDLYLAVGGMDEENLPVGYNDVDFCLRLQQSGYRNVWTPFAELYHHESYSRGYDETQEKQQRLQCESDYMLKRWGDILYNDPAYNPNLTLEWTDFSLACPPRVSKPWETSL